MGKLALRGSLFLLLASAACGPSSGHGDDGADAMGTGDPCNPGETRCVSSSFQACVNGVFAEQEACEYPQVCDPGLGCADCKPSDGTVCQGDDVHQCNADGTVGGFVETCEAGTCSNGGCANDCASGADLIYVVDDSYNLWSFDPRKLPPDQPFARVGSGPLSCSAGNSLPGWDPLMQAATPFSMSVDRDARAWVLYTSGEIFWVSTQDASCSASGFSVGQGGYELFGMGFVSDSPGSEEETLFIAGGAADLTGAGRLGSIDPGTLVVSDINGLESAEYSPELTGTGDAELYGYYPAVTGTNKVALINKGTAINDQTWNLAALCSSIGCSIRAWAFAHWGGQFYIFITTSDGLTETARVILLDPDTGSNAVISGLENTGKVVVGAGVSTCAPVYVP